MNKSSILSVIWLSVALAQSPDDFAYGLEVALSPEHSVYSLTLSEEVYRHLQSPLFNDLAVFNSDNKAVPYYLVEPRPYGEERPVDISYHLSRPQKQTAGAKTRSSAGYLITLPQQFSGYDWINFQWPNPDPAGALLTIWVSDDLRTWTRAGELELTDPELIGPPPPPTGALQNHLVPEMFPQTYLWLEAAPGEQLPRLTGAYLTYPGASGELLWLESGPGEPTTNGVRFDLGGFFPVQQVRIGFFRPPGHISGRLYADNPWEPFGIDINSSHLIEAGRDLISPPVRVADWAGLYLPGRVWRLKAENAQAEELFLAVGYTPHELIFLAEGQGPFILAYGSAQTRTRPELQPWRLPVMPAPAQVHGEPFALGGASRLTSDSPTPFWHQAGIYLVLALVAGVLVWLAYRLIGSVPET